MPEAIHYRIAGHLAVLGVHGINSAVMFNSKQDQSLLKDPEINTMVSLEATYLTIWNIFFQLVYALLAILCDLATVMSKQDQVPKVAKKIRRTLFDGVVFPITVLIFTIFWPIFLYDRELLFPAFIDKIFSFKSNMVMHFWILPLALWEVAFLPRSKPKTHKRNLQVMNLILIVYITVLLLTYYRRGLWPYPMLKYLFGTIYFPILIISTYCLCIFIYYKQWSLNTFFWGVENAKSK